MLPLRDVVVYPHMVHTLFVGRDTSKRALEKSMGDDKQILLVAQKDGAEDKPGADDIYDVGCVSTIMELVTLPDGTVKVVVEGNQRARILRYVDNDAYFEAEIERLESNPTDEREIAVLTRSVTAQFEQYVKLNQMQLSEVLSSLSSIDDPSRLADTIATHLSVRINQKQKLLEMENTQERLEQLMARLEAEVDGLRVEKRIRGRVKGQMERGQREYYLNEQMKAVQKELGEVEEAPNDLDELGKKIEEAGMSKEAHTTCTKELKKLRMMSPMSPEATVVRNYVDWVVGMPWKKRTRISKNLHKAEAVLEADHYGLDKVKERIVEYLAVQQRVKKLKGPILCLVGPPGVGKTSVGRSIARAANRKFVRMSLGGVRDEAEIRGHRRTYVGALPGKIVQNLSKAGVRNPLFLLDEVDKMSMDFRGDPSSALLEVLDPEQNHTFNDHYLEVDYDLSDVMFVATANTINIPPQLLDRMEVIHLPGYTEDEKVAIAERYLVPKQMKNNGLEKGEVVFSESSIKELIRFYTREAGVRNVEREIAKICRKVVRQNSTPRDSTKTARVTPKGLQKYLGVKRFRHGRKDEQDRIGQATGLAWTEVGGDLLTIEAAIVPGKGKSTYTGRLGDIMQESIRAALTVVRSRTEALGIESNFAQKNDVHIHVPEGATPKDGPSAGVGMCTAIVSSLTRIPVRANVAMTGEITLRGEVLPVGGLKEKLLAALRGGIEIVLIPEQNRPELVEIPSNIKKNLDIRSVQWIDQVWEMALHHMPRPLEANEEEQIAEGEESAKEEEHGRESTH